ncbi:MAG: hypothetical protein ABSB01_22005 [Streptosporangiaceae bacterium]|jgi:hypothetical protein
MTVAAPAGIRLRNETQPRHGKELVAATGSRLLTLRSTLLTLHGIGPSGAARLLGDVGDVAPRVRARALLLWQYEHPAIVCWRERRRAPSRDRIPDL